MEWMEEQWKACALSGKVLSRLEDIAQIKLKANWNHFPISLGFFKSGAVGAGGSASESTEQSCEGVKPKIKQTRKPCAKKVKWQAEIIRKRGKPKTRVQEKGDGKKL